MRIWVRLTLHIIDSGPKPKARLRTKFDTSTCLNLKMSQKNTRCTANIQQGHMTSQVASGMTNFHRFFHTFPPTLVSREVCLTIGQPPDLLNFNSDTTNIASGKHFFVFFPYQPGFPHEQTCTLCTDLVQCNANVIGY